MEKAMSIEERIRRAEDIYNRRYGNSYYSSYRSSQRERKNTSLSKRFIKQIIICLLVYAIFYVTANREYFLSNEFRNKAEEFTSQNEMLKSTYNYIIGYVDKYFNTNSNNNSDENDTQKNNEMNQDQQQTNQSSEFVENNLEKANENDQNIGGSNEGLEEENQKTQEEIDVEEIKSKIDFIVPVEGTISSTFGWRNPTSAKVPKNHTGLDLAAPTGTIIKSATDGVVTMVSSYGDYGKHYRIQNDDVTIIYAHCSKLYLNEGDYVTQGQEIAEVGSTGNSTGPHLHFEIRREDRLVDPQLILNI